MKDVFRKLADFLGLEKSKESSSPKEELLVDSEREIKPDIQVRTKVIYPQNHQKQGPSHFRFPIIPDEVHRERKPKSEVSKQVKIETTSVKQESTAVKANDRKNNDKKPFKPTEVVSPVYGRVDPRIQPESRSSNQNFSDGQVYKQFTNSVENQPSIENKGRFDLASRQLLESKRSLQELDHQSSYQQLEVNHEGNSSSDMSDNDHINEDHIKNNLSEHAIDEYDETGRPKDNRNEEPLQQPHQHVSRQENGNEELVTDSASTVTGNILTTYVETYTPPIIESNERYLIDHQGQTLLHNVLESLNTKTSLTIPVDTEITTTDNLDSTHQPILTPPQTEGNLNSGTDALRRESGKVISFPTPSRSDIHPVVLNELEESENLNVEQPPNLSQYENRNVHQSIEQDRSTQYYETRTSNDQRSSNISPSIHENVEQTVPSSAGVVEVPRALETPRASEVSIVSSDSEVVEVVRPNYSFPNLGYLRNEPPLSHSDDHYTDQQIEKLVVALENFNVKADVIGVVKGPTVTRYELQPAPGVKVNKFTNLIDDIKLALAAKDIRMEAPIPGRSAIGIEVPNEVSSPVFIRSIIESEEFRQNTSPLTIALGRDISGAPVIGDLKKMPHGLIAGSTGSGKSVCVNSIIISLLYKATPADVRLILIDPKVVELAPYNHIPHLLTPVVTDPKQATAALKWAVEEMDGRYEKFAETGARDIERYNAIAQREGKERLPYIVIVIDELADLMMVAPHDVEESICRIAQKARACGIHLLVATQRPSVDVITGLIKANIPTRIAFAVSSGADSRTILDMSGAERLLGKGDMLYYPSGTAKPIRLQGNFVSDDEIEQVIDHVKAQQKTVYLFDKEDLTRATGNPMENDDELFEEALLFVVEQGQASSSSLQRRFRIGYNRAARLVDMMEAEGFISGQSGSKPREVLLQIDEYRNLFG